MNQQIQLNLQKVAVMEEELDLLAEELDQKSLELDEKNAELDQKETEIDVTYEQYKQRMRAMYMAGDTSTLEMLFAADSFSDFLTNIEMMKAITAHDTELLDTLEVQKSSLTNQKTQVERLQIEIEEQQAEVETNKKALEETNQQLQVAYAESKTAMQDIELEKKQFEANLEAKKKEASQVQSEIDAIYAELAAAASNSNNSTMKDGKFIWPLPGYSTITSGYGARWGSTHTGIDISGGGCYGAGIVAAASGTVIKAGSHWSYGNYIIVDHGGGYTTLYAHCSKLLVSAGQNVAQGQKIALVGSTGQSTGPHLHFEVRINGKTQNPRNFV